jgi:class 3 adenylate cyclase
VTTTEIELDEHVLDERLAALEASRSWSPRVVAKLEGLIRSGDESDVFRINPYRFAADYGVDETEAVDLLLHASRVGLLDMDWMIVCASCANVFSTFRELEKLDPRYVCNLCSMDNTSDLDDYIQIGFTVSPQVRPISYHQPETLDIEDLYFRYHFSREVKPLPIGMTLPEIFRLWTKVLTFLDPGASETVILDDAGAGFQIRDVLHSAGALYLVDDELDAAETELDLTLVGGELHDPDHELGPSAFEFPNAVFYYPAATTVSPGTTTVTVTNRGSERAALWIIVYQFIPDELVFAEFNPVLSGKRLLSTQTFRDLFRSETIPESETLEVKDLTYLFTDLKGSTAMYDAIGDANAYNLVRLHFDALSTAIEENHGAITKTIGDAIMATFVDPADAVRAADDMLTVLDGFNKTSPAELAVKIGIHRGHSIAVTLNNRIDFFGQSVNTAARVQHLAGADEIMLTDDVFEAPGVSDALEAYDVVEETGIMKGVEEAFTLHRARRTR